MSIDSSLLRLQFLLKVRLELLRIKFDFFESFPKILGPLLDKQLDLHGQAIREHRVVVFTLLILYQRHGPTNSPVLADTIQLIFERLVFRDQLRELFDEGVNTIALKVLVVHPWNFKHEGEASEQVRLLFIVRKCSFDDFLQHMDF